MLYLIQQTETFLRWHTGLRDMKARIAIARRIECAAAGNLGDTKSVGGEISEMRIDIGAGYRMYFTRRDGVLLILLCGGDKSSQDKDIKLARQLAQEV